MVLLRYPSESGQGEQHRVREKKGKLCLRQRGKKERASCDWTEHRGTQAEIRDLQL